MNGYLFSKMLTTHCGHTIEEKKQYATRWKEKILANENASDTRDVICDILSRIISKPNDSFDITIYSSYIDDLLKMDEYENFRKYFNS